MLAENRKKGGCPMGGAVLSNGHKLPAKCEFTMIEFHRLTQLFLFDLCQTLILNKCFCVDIISTVGPREDDGGMLEKAYQSCFAIIKKHSDIKSVVSYCIFLSPCS